MTSKNEEISENQKILNTVSNAINVRQKAHNTFTKDVEYALYVKNKTIAETEKRLSEILHKYKDATLNALKNKKRYIPTTKDVIDEPDRIFVEKDGIRVEWDWEDRGYTENHSILVEWNEIFANEISE